MNNLREFYEAANQISERTPMTPTQTELMMGLMFGGKAEQFPAPDDERLFDPKQTDEKDIPLDDFRCEFYQSRVKNGIFAMPMTILNKRPLAHGFSISVSYGAVALLGAIAGNNPGKLVMYMAYLVAYSMDKDVDHFGINKIAEIFPWGFFHENDLHDLWLKQKGESGENRLDMSDFWKWN